MTSGLASDQQPEKVDSAAYDRLSGVVRCCRKNGRECSAGGGAVGPGAAPSRSAGRKVGAVSPLPAQLKNHWQPRPGWLPGREIYFWHLLFHDQPDVREVVAAAQARFDGLPEVDPVPLPWLHVTTLMAGFADEVPADAVAAMAQEADRRLALLAPIPIRLGFLVYDDEAVVLPIEPFGALDPILAALLAAAAAAGVPASSDTDPWLPHLSIAYANRVAPAAPLIAALGDSVPAVDLAIRSASLVAQTQVGRSYQWRPIAEAHLAGGHD